jgi:hypothetical protein
VLLFGERPDLGRLLKQRNSDPGNPEDWYDDVKYDLTQDQIRVGLASSEEEYGTIDVRKINALLTIPEEPDPTDPSKMYIKKGLGLENWAYNFTIDIYDSLEAEDPRWEYGPDSEYNIRKYFTRYILIKSEDGTTYKGKIVVSVFV